MCHFLALAGNRKSCDKKRLQFSAADGMITKQTMQGSFIGRTPYPPSHGRRVRSQAFCHRQMAAMRSIAAFGVVKRKCVGTRSRRSRRSIPVSHILYNVPTPGRRARRPGSFYGSRLGRMEDDSGKSRSCKTSISGISYVFTLSSKIVSMLPLFPV